MVWNVGGGAVGRDEVGHDLQTLRGVQSYVGDDNVTSARRDR